MIEKSVRHSGGRSDLIREARRLSALPSMDERRLATLDKLGISSIGDLLSYRPIKVARIMLAAARGDLPGDFDFAPLVDQPYRQQSQKQAGNWPLAAIHGLGAAGAAAWEEIGIRTVTDLARFAGYEDARQDLEAGADEFHEAPSAPKELLPTILGSIAATIRFSSFVREREFRNTAIGIGQCDPETTLSDFFTAPDCRIVALGYVGGYAQRWFNLGTHLGEIVHSIPLAAGQSRNIAVVDWKRTHLTRRDEDTDVVERVNSVQVHKRALDEVARAVAEEQQYGKTSASGNTRATAGAIVGAGAVIGAIGGGITGLVVGNVANVAGGAPTIAGAALGSAVGAAAAGLVVAGAETLGMIEADSSGNREIVADTQQRITQSTSQKSSAIRSLWSSVVLEDTQIEGEEVSTTNITNYNHMHALTVQYYEVLQHYRAQIGLEAMEPILYLPFKPIAFDINQIREFWPIIRDEIEDVELVAQVNDAFMPEATIGVPDETMDPAQTLIEELTVKLITPDGQLSTAFSAFAMLDVAPHELIIPSVANSTFNISGGRASRLFRQGAPMILERVEAIEIRRDFAMNDVPCTVHVRAKLHQPVAGAADLRADLGFQSLGTKDLQADLINENKVVFPWRPADDFEVAFTEFIRRQQEQEIALLRLQELIQRRRYHFSKLVLERSEPEQIVDVLEALELKFADSPAEIPLHLLAHTVPIGVTGSALLLPLKKIEAEDRGIYGTAKYDRGGLNQVLRYPYQLEHWLNEEGAKLVRGDDIYLPTSGLFAEAILGRANSAEYLNIRRYANWQDSPIPNAAPQIQPVAVESRHQDQDVSVTTPPATINLVNPPSFPDPAGMAGILAAIQNPNIFRDMSKAEQLTSILGSLSTLAGQMGQAAAGMTGQAATEAMRSATSAAGTVADLTKTFAEATPASGAPPPRNLTEKGSTLNAIDDLTADLPDGPEKDKLRQAIPEILGTPPGDSGGAGSGGDAGAGEAGGTPAAQIPAPGSGQAQPVSSSPGERRASDRIGGLFEAAGAGGTVADDDMIAIGEDWFEQELRPTLLAAEHDDSQLNQALNEWLSWRGSMASLGVDAANVDASQDPNLVDEEDEAILLVIAGLQNAARQANDRAIISNDWHHVLDAVHWSTTAAALGLGGPDNGLELSDVLAGMSMQVNFLQATLPATMAAGEEGQLRVQAALVIAGNAPTLDPAVSIELAVDGGVAVGPGIGTAGPDGVFTAGILRTGGGDVEVTVTAKFPGVLDTLFEAETKLVATPDDA
ncbi:MAG: hypothetical protein QF578_02770 [Alphaproteobacteria bacterium]|jgi:hypothetical protein|nr:hypothetical protein [Alphaproteobacteria bacterium]MDP6815301.1 hypothetical protein [Alphaproteobacteria bacterium]